MQPPYAAAHHFGVLQVWGFPHAAARRRLPPHAAAGRQNGGGGGGVLADGGSCMCYSRLAQPALHLRIFSCLMKSSPPCFDTPAFGAYIIISGGRRVQVRARVPRKQNIWYHMVTHTSMCVPRQKYVLHVSYYSVYVCGSSVYVLSAPLNCSQNGGKGCQ